VPPESNQPPLRSCLGAVDDTAAIRYGAVSGGGERCRKRALRPNKNPREIFEGMPEHQWCDGAVEADWSDDQPA
jgi:hypothetical protein